MPLSPLNTQALIPWPEAVTVTSVRRTGDVTASVSRAGVHQVGLREAARSNGVYQSSDIRVTLADDAVAWGFKPRDRVTWGGTTYTVLDVGGSAWMGFTLLTARNLALAADLRDTGTLYRPVPTADDAGRRVPNLAALDGAADIPCRVQPADGGPVGFADGKVMRGGFVCYLDRVIYPQVGDVWQVGSARYGVTGWHTPDSITDLMSLDLEAIDGSTT